MWVGSISLLLGDTAVRLATDDEAVMACIAEAYAPWRIDHRREQVDYGIRTQGAPGQWPTPIPSLLRGRSTALRSRHTARLTRLMDGWLDIATSQHPDGLVGVGGLAAFVIGDEAILVPSSLASHSSAIERQAASSGMAIADDQTFRLDLDGGAVVVSGGVAGPDRLGSLPDPGRVVARPGSYQLRSVAWTTERLGEHDSRGRRVVELMRHLQADGTRDGDAVLQRVAELAWRNPLPALDPTPRAVATLAAAR